MKDSIILTVYDREPEVLLATLRGLSRCDLSDSEVIVVNDGSHLDYSYIRSYMQLKLGDAKWYWEDIKPYSRFSIEKGFNCPSRALNQALMLAEGKNLYVLGSDVVIGPRVLERARTFSLAEMAWVPLVLDMESGMQYCGPNRLFPMPWFFACDRQTAVDVGGWDEKYLEGLCYEDNDFVGRVVAKTGRFIGDWSVVVYHQSHEQPAYRIEDPEIKAANDRNRQHTKDKWGGIPFDPEFIPFDIIRKPYKTGDVVHEVLIPQDLLDRTVEMTSGLFAVAK